ncbi:RNA polymerase subunit sigma [Aeromonas salmonicida]|uniref:sigma-70 family RNA polymerase sigma factor n=1 Tax=Aeromonas salmonicida TaxID=645 RepID=UPI000F782C04|nr:RNA polymerase subunit sigma [Aeromonas salmonicida]
MERDACSLQEQWQTLYRDNHGWLCRLLRRKLGNSYDAADLAHDIYLHLINKGHIPAASESRRYLMQIAKGKLIDLYRRRSLEARYLERQTQQPALREPSEETRALMREALGAVDMALQRKPPKIRQALLLSRLNGMGYQDIATELQVSVSSVEKYIALGLQTCHQCESDAGC